MNQAVDTPLTAEEQSSLDEVNLDALAGEEVRPKKRVTRKKSGTAISPAEQSLDGSVVVNEEPDITSPEWSDFVIRQLTEEERDAEGNPYVHGLRRITELLLGPILVSKAHVVQPPVFVEAVGNLQPATVEYTIRILWTRVGDNNPGGYEVEFTDCADVWHGNTEPEYARFPSSMASTRAEGRCYRKALRLRRVVAAEEMTLVPLENTSVDGKITDHQINFVDVYCRRLAINAMKYINIGQTQYSKIADVSYVTAKKMLEHLATLTNNPDKVPAEIKGYQLDWVNLQ